MQDCQRARKSEPEDDAAIVSAPRGSGPIKVSVSGLNQRGCGAAAIGMGACTGAEAEDYRQRACWSDSKYCATIGASSGYRRAVKVSIVRLD